MRRSFAPLLILWARSYPYYRATNSEVWATEKQTYVLFPATPTGQALYYLWRPLSFTDRALTGRGALIGAHGP
jgi:hypothetical protein